jgi:hypothetical protein
MSGSVSSVFREYVPGDPEVERAFFQRVLDVYAEHPSLEALDAVLLFLEARAIFDPLCPLIFALQNHVPRADFVARLDRSLERKPVGATVFMLGRQLAECPSVEQRRAILLRLQSLVVRGTNGEVGAAVYVAAKHTLHAALAKPENQGLLDDGV